MCTPEIFIRDDGKGFVVRKGGVDWYVQERRKGWEAIGFLSYAMGETIMEAVDNALAKVRAAESLSGETKK